MWSGLYLPTWGGKQGLLLGPLWKAWVWLPGVWAQVAGDSRLWHALLPQKHWMNQLDSRAEGRAVLPWTPTVPVSLAQLSWPFLPREQCLEAVWRVEVLGDSTGR